MSAKTEESIPAEHATSTALDPSTPAESRTWRTAETTVIQSFGGGFDIEAKDSVATLCGATAHLVVNGRSQWLRNNTTTGD